MKKGERLPSFQHFVDEEINKALMRANLPTDHAMRDALDNMAVVGGVREASVQCVDALGDSISIDNMIARLKADPNYRASIPAAPPTVMKGDTSRLRVNFDDIAAGKVVVK